MKKILILILFLSLSAGIWYCTTPEEPEGNGFVPEITSLEKSVVKAGNSFTMELFPALNEEETHKNIFISPFSISTALSMTYNGARGETRSSMAEILCFPDLSFDQVNNAYRNLTEYLKTADEEVTLNIANSIWIKENFDVIQEFIEVNRTFYDAEVCTLDFNNPESVDINWVRNKTEEKIEEIIGEIHLNACMYLINALYFKGAWTWQFDPDETLEMNFTCYDGTVNTVNMMSQKAEYLYYQAQDFQAIELPYGNEKFIMTVILPSPDVDINTFIAEMTQSHWDEWINSFPEKKTEIILMVPRFTLKYDVKLSDILSALGMDIAFTDAADFTGICPAGGIWINEVFHKTFIEVHEEGTEAAAATAVEMTYESAEPSMVLNRPFLFTIREEETETIFFIGKIVTID